MTDATGATDESSPRPADVFVPFDISGDLAKVMTFGSLYRLEQRGLRETPANDHNVRSPLFAHFGGSSTA